MLLISIHVFSILIYVRRNTIYSFKTILLFLQGYYEVNLAKDTILVFQLDSIKVEIVFVKIYVLIYDR